MWPFDTALFMNGILPFLLVFVLIFAILQKSKILGEGKSQIDALISLVIALILIIFPVPRGFIVTLMPWLAVGAVVILIFFILYGFVAGDLSGDGMPRGLKITFGILAGIFTLGLVVYFTGVWDSISSGAGSFLDSELFMSLVMIVIIGGAVAVAVFTGKKGSD